MIGRSDRARAEASEALLVGPLRGDLLGADHLAARARAVARGQRLVVGRAPLRPARLLARLADTRRVLEEAQERLLNASANDVDAGPAAEWLLDNYHVVQEHLQEVRESLPRGYYRELPELLSGPLTGYPRVYEMAITLISHTEARIDLENVDLFVDSFQTVTPLSIGELWATPAMLRIGLIESVRRMTLRTLQRLDERELASHWADRILDAGARGGAPLRHALREFAETDHDLTAHFVSRLLQLLRQTEGASPSLIWLEHWIREAGTNPDEAVAESAQHLALTQIMMANSITSLRNIGRRDWRKFVEHQSAMESILREDPSGFYALMTFATRDRYRHAVERIAKRTRHRETSVAQWAVDLARAHADKSSVLPNAPNAHVGFFLVDDGLSQLERMAGYSRTFRERVEHAVRAHPNIVFLGGLTCCTLLAVLVVLMLVASDDRKMLWMVLLFAFLPALDIAVSVFNQLATAALPPKVLPQMDLHEHGVPAVYRTAVVIPTLFGSVEDVGEALENLEVQYLANREPHLHFAVLSDFTDAPAETQPDDDAIITAALDGVRALNERHAKGQPEALHLFHRPRRWNAAQRVWMGWERKRGKLSDFNRLLRGRGTDAFSTVSSDPSVFLNVKYVITLDADTVLPPDAAPSLVGAMAHPLNRAVYDPTEARISRGYGMLQPRVGVSLPSAHHSRFAAIASGHPGVDPYVTAASDLYQDLYGEGSFTGKGIYDVDAFELATLGRFPENTLLSHDLLEGNYARAGLVTDVMVYDDAPSTYVGHATRKHRWIRGDWQLLPWLHRTVPGPDGPERNRLSMISRWKIVDNLRRSSVELTQLLFLIAGWTILPGSVVHWTLLGLGAIIAPWASVLARAIVQPPLDKSWRTYYAAVGQDAIVSAQQALLALIFLPHQAWVSVDAIMRTLYRVFVSRRKLLEWQSASFVERFASTHMDSWRTLHATTWLVAIGVVTWSVLGVRGHLALGLPLRDLVPSALAVWSIALLWLAAPRFAVVWSRRDAPTRTPLSTAERATARRYAAAHWHFFDRFVTADTHWLAPDNFQSDPVPVVAMRTSPTNIGLQLLATVSAFDLGFISASDMTERLERTVATIRTLPRYRGHFYNWYDLNDLRVLYPPYISTVDSGNLAGHLIALRQACVQLALTDSALRDRLHSVADHAYALVVEMDFTFLYDKKRKLFTIGFHPDSGTADDSYYDLLASEARLASFLAIAKNEVPVEHWFRLSRSLNRTGGATALVSWSGSMFEYLMPTLVMRTLPLTMLDQTCRGALDRQRAYARRRRVPWGISECAYNVRDHQLTYQYHAFGVPDLALQRGLALDLVIAPYATALAAMVDPPVAMANLQVLEGKGALGPFGFCDALDYTRPEPGKRFALVSAYMAHHIGMSLVSLTNVLLNNRWQDRFHADSLVRSAELLLHERVPRRLVLHTVQRARIHEPLVEQQSNRSVVREVESETSGPRIALLGTAPYTVMLNHNGSGYSRYEGLAVTRWRADGTRDDAGQFCYLKDIGSGAVWSSSYQPVCKTADESRAWLSADRVTLHRVDDGIETRSTITVVSGDAAEVRCVSLTNSGRTTRDIELTSYGEVVMAPAAADQAHPAFSNLFVETEWHAWCTAITATRRPRTADEPQLWCVHVVDAGSDRLGSVSCETDRARFLGRGRSVRDPVAMEVDGALSGTTGAVLDPIFALRTRVRVAPGQTVHVSFTTLVATSRAAAFALADRYDDPHAAHRARDVAWSVTESEHHELGITSFNASVFQDMATQLLYRGGSLAPPMDEVRRNRGSQPRLWLYGLSGDVPMVLATIDSVDGLLTLRELFVAHRYWRRRGLTVDLVVINAHPHDYLQELRDAIAEVMVVADDATMLDQSGGVFIRRRDGFEPDDFLMLSATARMHVSCDGRSLPRVLAAAEAAADAAATAALLGHTGALTSRALEHSTPSGVPAIGASSERGYGLASIVSALRPLVAPLMPRLPRSRAPIRATEVASEPLLFNNGFGGMNAQGDYCMIIDDNHLPPAPWINVIANPLGGFVVSERGAGCTWAENAYFFRLTPWHNDPVADPASDVLYLREVESGDVWSATPAPIRTDAQYHVRHGPGRSTFDHVHDGIKTALTLSMPEDAAVKLSLLRISNASDRVRRVTLTAFVEWTLGARRAETQFQVRTRFVPDEQAIVAHNHFDPNFRDWTAFLSTSEPVTSYSADRQTFLGRNGCLASPAALSADQLDGATGVGLDPCAALQMQIVLAPGESRDITVLLGAARSDAEARQTMARLRPTTGARSALTQAVAGWRTRLGVVTVRTPDAAFNSMINTWMLYQTLACRMWARTGLYQSSGAYGFRDQLQDVMALVYAEPSIARTHIVRAAARQFVEGDVQHWWHPHSGRGVRTRFSDDLAWLPFVVEHYVRVTGDASVLDEYVPFLRMRALESHEHELYDLPIVTDEHGSVYEHCRRALRRACTVGPHGLPLIGTGDWNDGMSRVGADGRGESIWLAWFLITTLRSFAAIADTRLDHAEATFMRRQADSYTSAVETHGWDGQWYRRAYYDDGTPIGSATSDECRIDSIAQSWSVISGAGSAERRDLAMRALNEQLVREDVRIIMLLTPPFDRGAHDPGYIKGYLPGIRENGAQYTHAALWAVVATAMRGDSDRAFELFQMLNPLTHSATAADAERYKVEPYVVAADVYTAPSQLGRGGWTWYTGSASWMYRVGLEHLLGFTKIGDTLRVNPRVPTSWRSYEISYRFGSSVYEISVRDPAQVQARGARVTVDGKHMASGLIELVDDGKRHLVIVDAPFLKP